MKKLRIGDWVTSYSKGIYRVERIITQYYDELDIVDEEDKSVGDEFPEKLVVSKRFLNGSFKKSIGYDSCSAFFIKPLDRIKLKTLREILKKNPNWLADLNNYQIPPIHLVHNMVLNLKTKGDVKLMGEFISFMDDGRTYREIIREMKKRCLDKYIPDTFGNYILQMTNVDDERKDKRTVWREANLLRM